MNTVMITRVAEAQWEAVANDRIVGHGDVSHRPDGRLFVSIDVWQDAIFDQLAAAMLAELPEPLYTLVGEADHELKSSWERLGFTESLPGRGNRLCGRQGGRRYWQLPYSGHRVSTHARSTAWAGGSGRDSARRECNNPVCKGSWGRRARRTMGFLCVREVTVGCSRDATDHGGPWRRSALSPHWQWAPGED
ncbi:hypothetical protein [Streptomyces sp. CA-106110]|uniref:hypothetical protein n=1 Tax=Streptomyces sp. CA-106110 TaxID=3240044 RepID=UPI003D8C699C